MIRDEIRVGAEIDAHCTRCRMLTNHRVVAMVEGTIKRVICLTCSGQHNYHPPAGQKALKGAKAKRVGKEQKKSRTSEPGVFEKWLAMKGALDPEVEIRRYALSAAFEEGEAVEHAKFGLGFVKRIVPPDKIEVMFEKEIKTLAMNRS